MREKTKGNLAKIPIKKPHLRGAFGKIWWLSAVRETAKRCDDHRHHDKDVHKDSPGPEIRNQMVGPGSRYTKGDQHEQENEPAPKHDEWPKNQKHAGPTKRLAEEKNELTPPFEHTTSLEKNCAQPSNKTIEGQCTCLSHLKTLLREHVGNVCHHFIYFDVRKSALV